VNTDFSRPVNDLYSNTYNLGWRNHQNFSWRAQALGNLGPSLGLHNQAHPLPPNQSYNYPPIIGPLNINTSQLLLPPKNSAFEEKVLIALGNSEANTQMLYSHSQSIAKLEDQVG
jgi:hypothetical protein